MEKSLDIQIGGKHYKSNPYQPVELICKINASFIQGNIIKYITRYANKNGFEDLQKVWHYALLAMDLKHSNKVKQRYKIEVDKYVKLNALTNAQHIIILAACQNDWEGVIDEYDELVQNVETIL